MKEKPLRTSTRLIKVEDPKYPGVVLFEAQVTILNLDTRLVSKIEGIDIKYTLAKPRGEEMEV